MKAQKIISQTPGGCIVIPPSKSVSHRMVMGAALAEGTSTVRNVQLSEDIRATCQAMEALGAVITMEEEGPHRVTLTITGASERNAVGKTFDCNESGSTLRFLIPLLALKAQDTRVVGQGRLAERPMEPYFEMFNAQGISYVLEAEGKTLPLRFSGQLYPGVFKVRGDISSQFITGLLYALPLLPGESTVEVTTPLESIPYVDITLEVLKRFGITIQHEDYQRFTISGNQHFRAGDFRVEGDYSQAAFWLVAGILGKGLTALDLPQDSCQGDRAILNIITQMGGQITRRDGSVIVTPGATRGATIDVAQCPDLVPVLAVLAALSEGETRIVGGERLRYKESDRLSAVREVLNTLGAQVTETPDGLIITGVEKLHGGQVDSFNDHRIAMATAVASVACDGDIILTRPDCVKKSYPEFWEVWNEKGGAASGIDLGK